MNSMSQQKKLIISKYLLIKSAVALVLLSITFSHAQDVRNFMSKSEPPIRIAPDEEYATVVIFHQRLPLVAKIQNYWVVDNKILGYGPRGNKTWFIAKVKPGTKFLHQIPHTLKKPLFSYEMTFEKNKIYYVFCNMTTGGIWSISPWNPEDVRKFVGVETDLIYLTSTNEQLPASLIIKENALEKAETSPMTEGKGVNRTVSLSIAEQYGQKRMSDVWLHYTGFAEPLEF